MAATLSVLYPLIQDSNNVIDWGTVNDNQILHKESIGWIPSTMQHSTWGIQQVPDLFIINLCKGGLDRKLLVFLLGVFPCFST